MELEEVDRSRRTAEASGQQNQRPPERDLQPVQTTAGVAVDGPCSPHHLLQPDHDGLIAGQRRLSATSEAVASISEDTTEAVSADSRLQPISTTEVMRCSQTPSPSPRRFANTPRQQRAQTRRREQTDGNELMRELLRRVRGIEDAIVGQQQGQWQGRYERLPEEEENESTDTREHRRGRLVEDRDGIRSDDNVGALAKTVCGDKAVG